VSHSFQYNLDDSGWRQLGSANDSSTAAPADTVILDTAVIVGPGLLTASPSSVFVFDVAVMGAGAATNDFLADVTVEARLDGAAVWMPLMPGTPYNLTGLRDGEHFVEARAR
jgi:hypothetical protein